MHVCIMYICITLIKFSSIYSENFCKNYSREYPEAIYEERKLHASIWRKIWWYNSKFHVPVGYICTDNSILKVENDDEIENIKILLKWNVKISEFLLLNRNLNLFNELSHKANFGCQVIIILMHIRKKYKYVFLLI